MNIQKSVLAALLEQQVVDRNKELGKKGIGARRKIELFERGLEGEEKKTGTMQKETMTINILDPVKSRFNGSPSQVVVAAAAGAAARGGVRLNERPDLICLALCT